MLNISLLLLPLGCTMAPPVLSERMCTPAEERRLPIVHQPPAAYAGGCCAHSWGQANLQMITMSGAMSCNKCSPDMFLYQVALQHRMLLWCSTDAFINTVCLSLLQSC